MAITKVNDSKDRQLRRRGWAEAVSFSLGRGLVEHRFREEDGRKRSIAALLRPLHLRHLTREPSGPMPC